MGPYPLTPAPPPRTQGAVTCQTTLTPHTPEPRHPHIRWGERSSFECEGADSLILKFSSLRVSSSTRVLTRTRNSGTPEPETRNPYCRARRRFGLPLKYNSDTSGVGRKGFEYEGANTLKRFRV